MSLAASRMLSKSASWSKDSRINLSASSYLPAAEVALQSVVNAASMGSTIVTAVADEDLWHNPPSFGNDYWDCLCSPIVPRANEGGKLMG